MESEHFKRKQSVDRSVLVVQVCEVNKKEVEIAISSEEYQNTRKLGQMVLVHIELPIPNRLKSNGSHGLRSITVYQLKDTPRLTEASSSVIQQIKRFTW